MIRAVDGDSLAIWLDFATMVWQSKRSDLQTEFLAGHFPNEFLYYNQEQEAVAWISLSLRKEYVEGARAFPVAYLEGIAVKPAYRKQGFAHQLLCFAKDWARNLGATQLASDALLDNNISQAVHTALGFREVSRSVHFIRDLDPVTLPHTKEDLLIERTAGVVSCTPEAP